MFSLRRAAAVMAVAVLTVGVGASVAAAEKIGGAGGGAAETSEVSAAATHGRIGSGWSDCPRGNFCAWLVDGGAVLKDYGYRWRGSDPNWRNNYPLAGRSINNNDIRWYNRGTSCPGCDHVRVYAGLRYSKARTICLAPGQRFTLSDRPRAAGRGSSHSWAARC